MSVNVMNKVVGDGDKHFDIITGHHMEHETKNKHVEQPLSDIIAKFHKIKEERFKPKDKNPFIRSKSPDHQKKVDDIKFETKPRPQRLESLIENRPQSASENPLGGGPVGARGGRRMSLPSLFHPLTPRPVYSDSSESIEKEDKEVSAHPFQRRHSMSHVMTEYSKHDLHHLSKIHEMRIQELNEVVDKKKEKKNHKSSKSKLTEDNDTTGWLTGEDLHAFYNMWENKGKKWKKKLHIRKPLSRNEAAGNQGDGGQHRPRVFSF